MIRNDKTGEKMVSIIKTRNNMFPLNISDVGLGNVALNVKENTRLWNLQLGHLNFESLRSMKSNEMVLGLPNISKLHYYETCVMEMQVRKPFPSKNSGNACTHLQVIHADICGSMQMSSLGGNKYY